MGHGWVVQAAHKLNQTKGNNTGRKWGDDEEEERQAEGGIEAEG